MNDQQQVVNNDNSGDVKVVVIGDYDVGKTSLLMTFLDKRYPASDLEIYVPTVLDSAIYPVNYNKTTVNCLIFDTGGGEHFEDIRPSTYPNANVILLCFSKSNRQSYINCKDKWLEELKLHAPPNIPILLVQTKIDLVNSDNIKDKSDFITKKEGLKMCKEINAVAYLECSSKSNIGIDNIFENIVKIGLKNKTATTSTADKYKNNGKIMCTIL